MSRKTIPRKAQGEERRRDGRRGEDRGGEERRGEERKRDEMRGAWRAVETRRWRKRRRRTRIRKEGEREVEKGQRAPPADWCQHLHTLPVCWVYHHCLPPPTTPSQALVTVTIPAGVEKGVGQRYQTQTPHKVMIHATFLLVVCLFTLSNYHLTRKVLQFCLKSVGGFQYQ